MKNDNYENLTESERSNVVEKAGIRVLNEAIEIICEEKIKVDGYYDFQEYIGKKGRKEDLYKLLRKEQSQFSILYSKPYPKLEGSYNQSSKMFICTIEEKLVKKGTTQLTYLEADLILYWVMQIFKSKQEKKEFLKDIFNNAKLEILPSRDVNVKLNGTMLYNDKKVDIKCIKDLSDFLLMLDTEKNSEELFYRGHANINYLFEPGILRKKSFEKNEDEIYQKLLLSCPDNFYNCSTRVEKLTIMQHYELPTRLLDITRNPMVALYFACCSEEKANGEVIFIHADKSQIKYYDDYKVSLLANLAIITYPEKEKIINEAISSRPEEIFQGALEPLLEKVKEEKNALPNVSKSDVLKPCIVETLKNNARIIRQDGAFILSGITKDVLTKLNKKNLNGSFDSLRDMVGGKKTICIVDYNKKEHILQQLDKIDINNATLFPEISSIFNYIRDKYK